MVIDKLHFFTLPYCLIFNASIYSIILSNDSVHLDWTEIIQTKVDLEGSFSLPNFQISIQGNNGSENSTNEVAKMEWIHSHQCMKKYMVRLRYNNKDEKEVIGELEISSPQLDEKIEIDLQTIPGEKFNSNP